MNRERHCPLCEKPVDSYCLTVAVSAIPTRIEYYRHTDGELHWVVNMPLEDCLPDQQEAIVGS